MPTDTEKEFLELPQSKLAIKLARSEEANKAKSTIWLKLWGARKPILALSAFIAAIAPLYQLNVAAINYTRTIRTTDKILETVEKLLFIDATADAQLELLKAKELSPRNIKIQEFQALIDLENTLRQRQDTKALNTLLYRYSNVIPSSPRASYLLGTAYIGVNNLSKALELLDQARKTASKNSYYLHVQILGAYIWIYARKFDSDGDDRWHIKSAEAYDNALKIVSAHPEEDFSRPLISLYHHYSFVMEQKARSGDEASKKLGEDLSEEVFRLSLATGNHTVIGKSAASLSAKLKDAGNSDEAMGMIDLAIEYAKLAEDERGLYNNLYTKGQIHSESGETEQAIESYRESLVLAIKHNDSRLQIYNNINLGTAYVITKRYREARASLEQAKFLARSTNDDYGLVEIQIIQLFSHFRESNFAFESHFLESATAIIANAKNAKLSESLAFWVDFIKNKKSPELFCELDPVFDYKLEIVVLNDYLEHIKRHSIDCDP